jgi:hypothetical protein
VKKVNMTPCKSSCTKVFTLWPRMPMKHKAIAEAKPKSSGGTTTKTGGSDPTFSACSRPKSAWGRSRPEAPYPVPGVLSTSSDQTFAIHFEGDNYAHH